MAAVSSESSVINCQSARRQIPEDHNHIQYKFVRDKVSNLQKNWKSLNLYILIFRRCLHFIVVRRFEYAGDPESYTSGSVATGRASLAGQVEG